MDSGAVGETDGNEHAVLMRYLWKEPHYTRISIYNTLMDVARDARIDGLLHQEPVLVDLSAAECRMAMTLNDEDGHR